MNDVGTATVTVITGTETAASPICGLGVVAFTSAELSSLSEYVIGGKLVDFLNVGLGNLVFLVVVKVHTVVDLIVFVVDSVVVCVTATLIPALLPFL